MIIFRVGVAGSRRGRAWQGDSRGEHGRAIRAAGLPNPKAMRVMSQILVLADSSRLPAWARAWFQAYRRTCSSALVAHVTTWNGSSGRRKVPIQARKL